MLKFLIRTVTVLAVVTLASTTAAYAIGTRSAGDYHLSNQGEIVFIHVGRNVNFTFTLETGSSREVLLRDIGQSGPGIQLRTSSGWSTTRVIAPHKSITVTLKYRIIDCARVPKHDWPLRLEARWESGKWYSISVQITTFEGIPWQTYIAETVCK
jgi:hypothetical protein